MNRYEALLDEVYSKGLYVKEKPLQSSDGRIKGNRIAIREDLETTAAKACVLAEEFGHYETTVGDIINISDSWHQKQEHQAKLWAYNKQIGLHGLIQAYEHGCYTRHEIAEYLDVTEEFLQNAVDCYRDKYDTMHEIDNYVICFTPNLTITKVK